MRDKYGNSFWELGNYWGMMSSYNSLEIQYVCWGRCVPCRSKSCPGRGKAPLRPCPGPAPLPVAGYRRWGEALCHGVHCLQTLLLWKAAEERCFSNRFDLKKQKNPKAIPHDESVQPLELRVSISLQDEEGALTHPQQDPPQLPQEQVPPRTGL